MTEVIFFYSVGSRYAYLASTQLDRVEAETGCHFDWQPIDGFELRAMRAQDPFDGTPSSGQYEWLYREEDARRWANYYRVPFVEPRGRVRFDSKQLARAATAGQRLGFGRAYSRALFDAMFRDPIACIDEVELVTRAVSVGLDGDTFRLEIESEETRAALASATRRAFETGAFGVPTFQVGDDIFWGNDRLALLQDHLIRPTQRQE